MKERWVSTGAVLVALAAVALAAKGVIAKLLYARGLSFDLVGGLRGVLAVPFYWAIAVLRSPGRAAHHATWQARIWAGVAGVVCYYGGGLLNLAALRTIDVSLERLVLFTYPTVVVILSAVMRRTAPSGSTLIALLGTYLGVMLAVLGGSTERIQDNVSGAALVFVSALTMGFYVLVAERMLRIIGSTAFTVWSMTAAAVAWCVHLLLLRPTELLMAVWMSVDTIALIAMLVVFSMVLPAFAMVAGIERIGAERAAIISTLGPPAAAVIAWLILGEVMTPVQMAGLLVVVGGVLLLERKRR